MQINKTNNTSFGLYLGYSGFLKSKHEQFLKPVASKLAEIGKTVDITPFSRSRAIERCGNAEILSDCIEFCISPAENAKTRGVTQIVRVFSSKFLNESAEKTNLVREKMLSVIRKAANKVINGISAEDLKQPNALSKVYTV